MNDFNFESINAWFRLLVSFCNYMATELIRFYLSMYCWLLHSPRGIRFHFNQHTFRSCAFIYSSFFSFSIGWCYHRCRIYAIYLDFLWTNSMISIHFDVTRYWWMPNAWASALYRLREQKKSNFVGMCDVYIFAICLLTAPMSIFCLSYQQRYEPEWVRKRKKWKRKKNIQ